MTAFKWCQISISSIVLESLVQSGFLAQKNKTKTKTSPDISKTKKDQTSTKKDWDFCLFQSLDVQA